MESSGIRSVNREISEPSGVSMKSDRSMGCPPKFNDKGCLPDLRSVNQKVPEPSCVSMKSDRSMGCPPKFNDKGCLPDLRSVNQKVPEPSCVSMKSDRSMGCPPKLNDKGCLPDLRSVNQKVPEPSCVSMKSDRSMGCPPKFNDKGCLPDLRVPQEESDIETGQISWKNNQTISIRDIDNASQVCNAVKAKLKMKFQCLYEGTAKQETPKLLNEIYTELYITEGESEDCNEHEVRQIERQSRRTAIEDTPIRCNDIFGSLTEQDKPIRTVLTKGVAGIGKTVSVQKFVLDWAEGKENQDIHLIFPLPFRELNLIHDQKLSLLDLLHIFFTETKELDIPNSEYKVSFIFDGLDECRLSLDFQSNVRLCDVTESASLDVLLTNLIAGNLLPSAFIWITTRPAAADLIPSECVHRVTEVRGFNEPQKEEYFRKIISDQTLANRIISHLKSSRSLFIMCHIPVFCWISATVLKKMLSEAESGEIPKTLTQMYTHFLIIQTNIKHEKDYEKTVKDEDMILKLGKLAFQQLVKGNLIFYEEDLRECGIDVTEASVYSGLCTIFREESGLYQGKVYCFVHLSIQEHLAALYGHISFIKDNINAFDLINKGKFLSKCLNFMKYTKPKLISISNLHQKAVDKTLHSKNGHLDLFLRFLLGFSLECNQTLLQCLLTQTGNSLHNKEKTVQYIKQKIKKNLSPEKFLNLFHCLNELGDCSLMEQIQHYVTAGTLDKVKLSSSQWSALIFVLLTSEQEMNVFKLKDFVGSQMKADEVLLKLLPVVKAYRSAQLNNCDVTDEGCVTLASTLRSNTSQLRELNLSGNKLGNLGVKQLSDGLEKPHCKLEKLWLRYCEITHEGCAALASALKSNPSHLRELDLSWNKLGDSGVNQLSVGLENIHCKLEKLCLSSCDVTDECCATLSQVLRSNPSHLRELNLSWNKIKDSGVKLLSVGLENPHCKLEKLWLSDCSVAYHGCAALASALESNPSHLRELDLVKNKPTDSGMKLLSDIRNNADYKLETLRF
ncbi:NACHT, LRR and PYD domains-containing protein 3-like [Pseudorasbora parva]|uniref:NACHT, LRR and PYD domains-containing protein 3-like n=1 Tax=Pseudorasbora parva TaxID=51549 RepID=UPI00351F3D5E